MASIMEILVLELVPGQPQTGCVGLIPQQLRTLTNGQSFRNTCDGDPSFMAACEFGRPVLVGMGRQPLVCTLVCTLCILQMHFIYALIIL